MYYAKLVHPGYGSDSDGENVKPLKFDTFYPVEDVSIGQSFSSFRIIGMGCGFNTVQFDFFNEDKTPISIFDTEYNPYRTTYNPERVVL